MKHIRVITLIALAALITGFRSSAQPTNWTLVLSNTPTTIDCMAYGNGTFVGGGYGFWAVTHDGTNWTTYASPPYISSIGISYGNGQFMAYGASSQNSSYYVLQSTNGINWQLTYTSSNSLYSAAYGNNKWVFVGPAEIVTASPTLSGWSWTDYQPPFRPSCITFANGLFVISVDWYGPSFLSSSDGLNWQYQSRLPSTILDNSQNWSFNFLTRIVSGNGVFIASAIYYSTNPYKYNATLFASTNLVNWVLTDSHPDFLSIPPSQTITYNGNQFVYCLGNYNNPIILESSIDGYSWNYLPSIGISTYVDFLTCGQGTIMAGLEVNGNFAGGIYQSGVFYPSPSAGANFLALSTYPGVTIGGLAGAVYQIQDSLDLTNWQSLTNIMLPYSPYLWIDTSSIVTGHRFYRSVQLQ